MGLKMPGISYKEYFKYAVNSDADTFLQYSLTAGVEQGDLKLSFATNPRPPEITRIAYDISDEVIIQVKTWADTLPEIIEAGMDVGLVALINHNLPAGSAVKVETFADRNGTTADFTETFTAPARLGEYLPYQTQTMYMKLGTAQSGVHKVLITISYPDASGNNLDLGRLWIGNFMSVDNPSGDGGFDGDWDLGYDGGGSVSESIGLNAFMRVAERRKEMDFPFREIPFNQAFGVSTTGTFQEMLFYCTKTSEIIMLPFEDTQMNKEYLGIYGLIANKPRLSHRSGKGSTDIQVKQLV